MSGVDAGIDDGSAGGVRQKRPRGALTGALVGPPGAQTRTGPTAATPNRADLPIATAFDIATNPFSKQATTGEKVIAGVQTVLPGGGLVGLARTASLAFGSGGAPSLAGSEGGEDETPSQILLGAPPPTTAPTAEEELTPLQRRRRTQSRARTSTTASKALLGG